MMYQDGLIVVQWNCVLYGLQIDLLVTVLPALGFDRS